MRILRHQEPAEEKPKCFAEMGSPAYMCRVLTAFVRIAKRIVVRTRQVRPYLTSPPATTLAITTAYTKEGDRNDRSVTEVKFQSAYPSGMDEGTGQVQARSRIVSLRRDR